MIKTNKFRMINNLFIKKQKKVQKSDSLILSNCDWDELCDFVGLK